MCQPTRTTYASSLLKQAHQIFVQENFDIGLLQTDAQKTGQLYGKIGFIPAHKAYQFIDSKGKTHTTKAESVMIAPINSKDKITSILKSQKLLNSHRQSKPFKIRSAIP